MKRNVKAVEGRLREEKETLAEDLRKEDEEEEEYKDEFQAEGVAQWKEKVAMERRRLPAEVGGGQWNQFCLRSFPESEKHRH